MFARGKKVNHEWTWQDLFSFHSILLRFFSSSRHVHMLLTTATVVQPRFPVSLGGGEKGRF